VSAKALVIANPKAGSGRGAKLDEQLKVIEGALDGADVALTERPRHAAELAERAASEGREVVVAFGGDGSIHEVVNGLMRAREAGHTSTALGVIGRGTGSDFNKTLGIEPRLDRFLAVIRAGHTRSIDIGRARFAGPNGSETAFFMNILSAGMGGLVDRYVHDTSGWAGGRAGYFLASTRALLESQVGKLRARIELDGETREEMLSTRQISICNGRFFGSGMQVAPMAELDDGVFEVIDMGDASRLKFALSSSAVYSGAHLKNPDVKHFRCQKLSLEILNERARPVFLLDVDGEPLGGLPLEVELLPRALPVLLPKR
jgi:diacylglycerol kinase (ATP)